MFVVLLSPSQGHSSTSSLWAAAMFTSLVSPSTDLVVWEYALNEHGNIVTQCNQTGSCDVALDHANFEQHVQSSLDLFMLQAELHPSRPRVLFVYLWDFLNLMPPFPPKASTLNATLERALRHHLSAGVIDAGLRIRRMCAQHPETCSRSMFVHDSAHVATDYHTWIAGEIERSVLRTYGHALGVATSPPRPRHHREWARKALDSLPTTKAAPHERMEWPCSHISADGALVWRDVLSGRVRSLSWTSDVPALEPSQQGLGMSLERRLGSDTELRSVTLRLRGKRRRHRLDRQRHAIVPRCVHGWMQLAPLALHARSCRRARGLSWFGEGPLRWQATDGPGTDARRVPLRAFELTQCHFGMDFTHWLRLEEPVGSNVTIRVCSEETTPNLSSGVTGAGKEHEGNLRWVSLFCDAEHISRPVPASLED